MSLSFEEKNTKYLSYLANFGLFNKEQYQGLTKKCSDKDEKRLLFELSNFFSSLTASDWFDVSCRLYTTWSQLPDQEASKGTSKEPQSSQVNGIQSHSLHPDRQVGSKQVSENESYTINMPKGQNNPSKKDQNTRSSVPTSIRTEPSQSNLGVSEAEIPSSEAFEKFRARTKVIRLFEILNKQTLLQGFDKVKNYYYWQKLVMNAYNYSPPERNRPINSRDRESSGKKPKRGFVESNYHLKLYADHFKQQEELLIKREMKKLTELDGCTFVPRVNPLDLNYAVVQNILKIPVYERLAHVKPLPEEMLMEKREVKELKGATFSPDISRSSRNYKKFDKSHLPADLVKHKAAERLYSDAQLKEKITLLRRIYRVEHERDKFPFQPHVNSPTRDRQKFIKEELPKSVERLYSDNLRRERDAVRKEALYREIEQMDCPFQPERPARRYKGSPDNKLFRTDIPVFERLYSHRKLESNSKSQNVSKDEERSRPRSQSVSDERIKHSARKTFLVEQLDLSTPAFDRLYNDMIKKRVRMDELRGRVQKEEGITFYPKTNSVKNKLNPSRSYTSFRQSSKQEKMEESFTKKHSKKDLLMNGENNNHNGLVEQKTLSSFQNN